MNNMKQSIKYFQDKCIGNLNHQMMGEAFNLIYTKKLEITEAKIFKMIKNEMIILRPGMLCKPRCNKKVLQFKRAQLK